MLTTPENQDLAAMMHAMGQAAKTASRQLAIVSQSDKTKALAAMAGQILRHESAILDANERDVEDARKAALTPAMIDRLILDKGRVSAMAGGIEAVAALKDPVGDIIAQWERPNGLVIERVRTPLGVIGVIYESRPNVTADAAALCLKSGNAVILRGGSDSARTSKAIHDAMLEGLDEAGLSRDAIQLVPVTDRAAVGAMLGGLDGAIDVIVPRGGRSLVERVNAEARVPVFAHLEGICHVYVDASADPAMAQSVVVNSKMRRTGICGAAETLLVDRGFDAVALTAMLEALVDAGCEIRGDAAILAAFPAARPARQEDWATEYLDAVISVAMVDGVEDAMAHIARYSSGHTEAVIAEDQAVADRFFQGVDSAILLHNASTQFADGGEFGMGAEIGIATGKMHARGPVGVEQLTSFNYRVRGNGQTRP